MPRHPTAHASIVSPSTASPSLSPGWAPWGKIRLPMVPSFLWMLPITPGNALKTQSFCGKFFRVLKRRSPSCPESRVLDLFGLIRQKNGTVAPMGSRTRLSKKGRFFSVPSCCIRVTSKWLRWSRPPETQKRRPVMRGRLHVLPRRSAQRCGMRRSVSFWRPRISADSLTFGDRRSPSIWGLLHPARNAK